MKTVLKTLALVATFAGFVSCGSNPVSTIGNAIPDVIPDVIPDLPVGETK